MEMNFNPQLVKLVQTQHPEKILAFTRNLENNILAGIYGMEVDTYLLIKNQLTQQAKEAAEQLLQSPDFAAQVDRLPFKRDEIVVGVGESTTDDLLSWFEILRYLLELQRPQDRIHLINEGISNNTTTQVLSRFSGIVTKKPDWVLCMIGANDTMRIGQNSAKPLVSLEETAKNLNEIRRIATTISESNWVWITPPTFDEERIAAFKHFQTGQLSWKNKDILAVGDLIREMSEPVIDTQAGFGLPAQAKYMGIDGVHPTIEGHKAIICWVVESLTGSNER